MLCQVQCHARVTLNLHLRRGSFESSLSYTVYVSCALAAKYFRAQFLALFFALGCKPTSSFADLFALLFVYLIVHFYRLQPSTER